LSTRYLKPFELFLGVKLTEALFHLRPKALKRLLIGKDKHYLQIMRHSMGVGIKVILAEIYEFLFETKFSPQGSMKALHGTAWQSTAVDTDLELPRRALQTNQTL
jgi:hypothetical protein